MADRDNHQNISDRPQRGNYRVKLRLARLVLLWELLWPAIWPACGTAALFVAIALLDLLPQLPGWLHLLLLGGFLGAFAYLAWNGLRRLSLPAHDDARRRLETASGFEHRPLTVLEDDLAAGAEDSQSAALWELHRKRMAELVRRLRIGIPSPGLAARDPLSLRGALLLVLVIAGVAAWPAPGTRLLRAITPEFGAGQTVTAGAFDLWIAPPDYTGMAPLFPLKLKAAPADGEAQAAQAAQAVIEVPVNSRVIAQVQGRGAAPTLVLGEAATDFTRIDALHSRIEATITKGGVLAVKRGGEVLASWQVTLIPDEPPAIAYAEKPAPTPRSALRLSFTAEDDYGLAGAKAVFRRTYEKGEVIGKETSEIELSLPGRNARKARETGFHDLAPHKWAGMPVMMELIATDAVGQTGKSEKLNFLLPERLFVHPVARAIIEQRKRLTDTPEKRASVISEIEHIAAAPNAYANDTVVFLALSALRSRLLHNKKIEDIIDSARDLMWDTALRLEDGTLSIAERDLRRAREALSKALANNASDAELERLMRELQAALNRYLRALAQQAQQQPPQAMKIDPNMMMMQGSDFQRMMEQLRNMIRSGARQAARDMLARLQSMLENLRTAQILRMQMPGMPGAGMMRKLQDLMRRQQQLMDNTFRQARPGQGRPGAGRMSAAQQRALREALRQLRGRMPGAGPGRFLDQALDRLQQAGRGLMRQMMERFTRRSGGRRNGRGDRNRPRRDPLGREMGDDFDSSDVKVPDQADIQRAQKILDELRRRAGQFGRPLDELDYINRLLQRF
ncbi:MAG: TIGR02302 family protein [Alphaproteobacteria bacterium]